MFKKPRIEIIKQLDDIYRVRSTYLDNNYMDFTMNDLLELEERINEIKVKHEINWHKCGPNCGIGELNLNAFNEMKDCKKELNYASCYGIPNIDENVSNKIKSNTNNEYVTQQELIGYFQDTEDKVKSISQLIKNKDYELIDVECPCCENKDNLVFDNISIKEDGKILSMARCTRCLNGVVDEVILNIYEKEIIKMILRITFKGNKNTDNDRSDNNKK